MQTHKATLSTHLCLKIQSQNLHHLDGGLDWLSGKISSPKGWAGIGTGCPGHHPCKQPENMSCSAWGHALQMALAVLGQWLDLMIIEGFSSLNE